MSKNKKSCAGLKTSKYKEGIVREFDGEGEEQLTPQQRYVRSLNEVITAAIQGTAEPWKTRILNMGNECDDSDVVRLSGYIKYISFLHVMKGPAQGCPLRFPGNVCQAIIDARVDVKPGSQCPSCGYVVPGVNRAQGNQIVKESLFTDCPLCGSKL